MPGKKSNEEKMKIYWSSAVGTLVLSFYFPWKTRDLERYVGFIVDRPIVGKVGSSDAKV